MECSNIERDMHPSVWKLFVEVIRKCFGENLADVVDQIPLLDREQRKALISISRMCSIPHYGSKMYKDIHGTLGNFMLIVNAHATNKFHYALILQACMNCPISEEEKEKVECDMVVKEMAVMESMRPDSRLNYSPFFGRYWDEVVKGNGINPQMAILVHKAIDRWIDKMCSKVHYPQVSSRIMHHSTIEQLILEFGDYRTDPIFDNTYWDLERLYHRYGYLPKSPSIMKQRWYPSQFKPRTYFAMGITAFLRSRYVGRMFTDLCDEIPSCHRRGCNTPNRLTCNESEEGIIYDLTSFTSNLAEQYHFLIELSHYTKGRIVQLFDTYHGYVSRDLGALIYDYSQEYVYPMYVGDDKFPGIIGFHSLASFLGTYGNIKSATFLHTIVVLQTVSSTDKVNIAGDDGIVCQHISLREHTLRNIRSLGILAMDKVFSTRDHEAIHLKRAIHHSGDTFSITPIMHVPLWEYPPKRTLIDSRYPSIRSLSRTERMCRAADSLTSSLKSLSIFPMDDNLKEQIFMFFCIFCQHMGLTTLGNIPQVLDPHMGFVPIINLDCIGKDPVIYTLLRFPCVSCIIPFRGTMPLDDDYLENSSFLSNPNRYLTILCKLGYLKEKKALQFVQNMVYPALISEYMEPEIRICSYSFIKPISSLLIYSR